MVTRPSGRKTDELREIRFTRGFTRHAAGSVLVEFGGTRVICTASVEQSVPPFLRGKGVGWVTAEYGMLPGATHTRVDREAARGKQSGRTVEIQRLIGRSLRAAIDTGRLGDGGTRTASITGASVALADALASIGVQEAFREHVASVSVGIWRGEPVLDLDYAEDSSAETDMNVVALESGGFVEIQGTAEQKSFSADELAAMLALAGKGTAELVRLQRACREEA